MKKKILINILPFCFLLLFGLFMISQTAFAQTVGPWQFTEGTGDITDLRPSDEYKNALCLASNSDRVISIPRSLGGRTVTGITGFANTYIDEVILPSSVTKMTNYCFNSSTIKKINTQNIEVFGYGCFMDCLNLTSLTFGEDFSKIDFGALGGCSGLKDLIFLTDFTDCVIEYPQLLSNIWWSHSETTVQLERIFIKEDGLTVRNNCIVQEADTSNQEFLGIFSQYGIDEVDLSRCIIYTDRYDYTKLLYHFNSSLEDPVLTDTDSVFTRYFGRNDIEGYGMGKIKGFGSMITDEDSIKDTCWYGDNVVQTPIVYNQVFQEQSNGTCNATNKRLNEGIDYSVRCVYPANSTQKTGEMECVVQGLGIYSNYRSSTPFYVYKGDLNEAVFSTDMDTLAVEYTGSEVTIPSFTMYFRGDLLIRGVDYEVQKIDIADYVNTGEKSFFIRGIGDYEYKNDSMNFLAYHFNVTPKNIEDSMFHILRTAGEPIINSDLVVNQDYTYQYEAASKRITITGKGNYMGVVIDDYIESSDVNASMIQEDNSFTLGSSNNQVALESNTETTDTSKPNSMKSQAMYSSSTITNVTNSNITKTTAIQTLKKDTITIKKKKGVTSYQIYRKVGKGKWKKFKTIKKSGKVTIKLNKKKVYRFKTRYKKGGKVSKFSKTIVIKKKKKIILNLKK